MQQRTDRIKTLAAHSRFRIGALLVQPDRLTVALDGTEIALEPRVMEVLVALAEHAGEVVSAEQLLIEVWRGTFYGDNPVHKAIAQLRKLIGDDSRAPRYIETIRKRGYRLIASVSFPDDYRSSAIQTTAWSDRSPYVGLSAFDGEHTDVFFGRSRMTAELLAAMRSQINNQRRFVLIVGASGCGKTSLLRAGAIPLLRQDSGFDGLRTLSVATCDLASTDDGDVLTRLASALATWTLDERPVFAPQPEADLAQTLRQAPDSITGIIDDAFRRSASRELAQQPYAHLLLVIDHAETLVASKHIDSNDRAEVSRIIEALCESPRVLVTMIARSDFYPKLIEAMPAIAERKAGDGHLDVLTPRPGEIAQIIRLPAMLAGLTFEEDAQTLSRLDDVLRDAAAEHPDALPLLQHTLQALYERKTEAGELRFSAYRDIGGLEGALAHRAEEVFAELPADAKARLDAILAQLIVIQPDSDSISARWVRWSSLQDDAARKLAETFIRARLFVGELRDGRPGFGVAHEALLRQWPRAREWAQDNRRLLHARARLKRAAARWIEERRSNDHLLNPGQPLSEALEAARELADDLSADEQSFLRASRHQHQRKRWLRIGAVALLASFAAIASTLAIFAIRARDETERRREEAQQLSDFMLVDLADKLRPLGNLKLLDSISAKVLSQFKLRPENRMDTEDLINRSRALRTAGEVMMEQAKLADAESAFIHADAAARAAVARAPESTSALTESGIAAYWLGYYFYRGHDLENARRHWATYLDTSERVVRLDPGNRDAQVELSYAYNNLGTVAKDQGRTEEAIDYFHRSADLKRRVLAADPGNTSLEYELIDTLSWISSGDESMGRLAEAASGYDEQIGMLRALISAEPGSHAWERLLAVALLRSGQLQLARGQIDMADTQIGESIRMLKNLVRREPDNRDWGRDLALAHMEAGDIATYANDLDSALAHLKAATSQASTILASAPQQLAWKRLDTQIRLRTLRLRHDGKGREHEQDTAIAELESISAQTPEDLFGLSALAEALLWRGRERHAAGRPDDARKDWTAVDTLLAKIARTSKDKTILAPWIAAQCLLNNQKSAHKQLLWLDSIGYRHPGFVQWIAPLDASMRGHDLEAMSGSLLEVIPKGCGHTPTPTIR
jgi:eukaryotic-like serine/threonine-protein kinase